MQDSNGLTIFWWNADTCVEVVRNRQKVHKWKNIYKMFARGIQIAEQVKRLAFSRILEYARGNNAGRDAGRGRRRKQVGEGDSCLDCIGSV